MPNYQEFIPSNTLLDYVESIWVQESDASPEAEPTTVLPTGRIELILHYRDHFSRVVGGDSHAMSLCHVVGQQNKPIRVKATGKTGIVIVRFKPWAAAPLFGDVVPELENRVIDMDRIWPQSVIDDLHQRLLTARTSEQRIKCVEEQIKGEMQNTELDHWCHSVVAAMNESWGNCRISTLAREFGLSRRHFNRRFSKGVGTSPKKLLGVLRVQKAVACLRNGVSVQDVVFRCGYSDQSHLIRDVLTYTGKRPGELCHHPSSQLEQFFNNTNASEYCGQAYL